MKEEYLRPGPGYAIVGRWVHPSENNRRDIVMADTYFLKPGEGLLFTGKKDDPGRTIRFQQSDLADLINETDLTSVQLMAIVEARNGGLLFTDMTAGNSFGIGRPTPEEKRIMIADYGRITFAGIWGETEKEARDRLKILQQQRLRRN